MTANIHDLNLRYGVKTTARHPRHQRIEFLHELNRIADTDGTVVAALAFTRTQEPTHLARTASVVRYLEPALVPVAAAVWLHNLTLILL